MVDGVVLAFHGTSGRADWPVLDPFMGLVKTANPKCHIIPLAFTGPKHQQGGGHCDPLAGALGALAALGCGRAVVQPLYVVAGEEYEALEDCLARLEGTFPGRVGLSRPLLSGAADTLAVARALIAEALPERSGGRAVVFMGHGSKRPAQKAYAALAEALEDHSAGDAGPVMLATLKQAPASPQSIHSVAGRLAASGAASVALIPLTFAVGAHARNDMASDRPDSFASVLTRAGMSCTPVMTGLNRREGVLRVWLDHLREALAALA
ncbi:MAG: sirohydrochlorin cobaltochelatase [Desulfovibrionaceae bacterium]|nr:sirohydrochlorin cobaltochelatase [Desulfovibrionaceae bacterium]